MNTQKPNKKDTSKKPIKKNQKFPNLPPNTKIVEITGKKILTFIIILALLFALLDSFGSAFSPVQKKVNTQIGLQQVVSNYTNKAYTELKYYPDGTLEAIKPELDADVNGKISRILPVDKISLPLNISLVDAGLSQSGNTTKISFPESGIGSMIKEIIPGLISTILMVVLFIFLMSRVAGNGPMGNAMSFIRSKAKVYDPDGKDKVTFADVAGSEEEKSDLEEVVDFLKNPEKYKKL